MATRLFCFTNYAQNVVPFIADLMECLEFQFEICPTSGRPHQQGWFYTKKRVRITTIKSALEPTNPGLHLEVGRGTWEDCHKYCTKEETREPGTGPVLNGVYPKKQGQHGKWHKVQDDIKSGKSVGDIIDDDPNLAMYSRAVQVLNNVCQRKITRFSVEVWWVYGGPGVGKSHGVRKMCKNPYVTRVEPDGRIWFNGYETTQDALIIEEMVCTDDSPLLRQVLDKYDMLAPVKMGEPITAGWTRVFITSNDHPPAHGPIADRIDKIVHVNGVSRRKRPRMYEVMCVDEVDREVIDVDGLQETETAGPQNSPVQEALVREAQAWQTQVWSDEAE